MNNARIIIKIRYPLMYTFLLAFLLLIPSNVYANTLEESKGIGTFHGFYPAYATYTEEIENYMKEFDSISFAFAKVEVGNDQMINRKKGENNNYDFYYPTNYQKLIFKAKELGKTIQLSFYMDGKNAIDILPTKSKRNQLVKEIVEIIKEEISRGSNLYYDGIVIDFEELRDTNSNGDQLLYKKKPISDYFITFLKEMKKALPSEMSLTVAVNTPEYYDGYNYNNILEIADSVILMAHDYEEVGKLKKSDISQYISNDVLQPLNSLSPIQRIHRAINQIEEALTDRVLMEKLILQISFDTAQWQFQLKENESFEELDKNTLSKSGRISPLYSSIKSRIENTDKKGENITYGYNSMLQAPYIHYYNKSDTIFNFILYEDSNSLNAKIQLGKMKGLGGISIWGLNNIPDYSDKKGKAYFLDGWDTILDAMETYHIKNKNLSKIISLKDKNLEASVRVYLGKANGDLNKYDLQMVYRLKLSSSVKSLADLKYLTNLEYINISGSSLKNVKHLSYTKNLKVAYLKENQITDITGLATLVKLEKLVLNKNKIKDISSLKSLTGLKELYLNGNPVGNVNTIKKLIEKNNIKIDIPY